MNKIEIPFKTISGCIECSCFMHDDGRESFDCVYKYLSDKNYRYVKHFVVQKWYEKPEYGLYEPVKFSEFDLTPPIPKGDLIYTIVLYYESCK